MNLKIITLGIVSSFFLSGCVSFFSEKTTSSALLKEEQTNKIYNKGVEVPKFEKELIRISSKTEESYNNFYYLLKKRKEVEKEKEKYSIPKNMGAKISLFFDGYSGILLKSIVEKADYKLLTKDISLTDTKIVSKKYKDTTINDILQDLSVGNGFNVVINEKENIVYIKAEE